MSIPKYTHASYSLGWIVKEPIPEKQPHLNWFQRVILRRKPKLDLVEVSKQLARSAYEAEKRLVKDIFNNGHS